jgi:hypothetical protein
MITAVSRAPRSWETQTWALLGLTAASALAGLVTLVTLLGVRNFVVTRGASGTSVLTDWALGHAALIDNIYFVLVLAYLAAFYWWRAQTRQLVMIFGDSDGQALEHWAFYVWNVLIFFSFVIRFTGHDFGTDPAARRRRLLGQGPRDVDRRRRRAATAVVPPTAAEPPARLAGQARTAQRFGLYRENDPAALHAVTH